MIGCISDILEAREEADWIEDGLERQHRHDEFLLIRSLITIGFISSVFLTMTTVVFITFLESNWSITARSSIEEIFGGAPILRPLGCPRRPSLREAYEARHFNK